MKVFYQNAEIGIMKDDVTIGEMFKTNLDFGSPSPLCCFPSSCTGVVIYIL